MRKIFPIFLILLFAASLPAAADMASKSYVDNIVAAIPTDSDLVHKTGDETIGGQKTFGTDMTVNGDINVGFEVRAGGDIRTEGELQSGASAIIGGDAQIDKELSVSGEAHFNSDVYVSGEIHAGDIGIRAGQQLSISNGADFQIYPGG
ncbi:MAG: hypothetical protein LBJ18_04070, partial [Rickettsiales bacterium]|nr:hypothetical protein [Rickettsiales bacterium]